MKFEKREVKSNGGGASYLKFEAGKSVTGVLRGEALEFFQIWPYGGEKQVFDVRVPGSTSRFKANLIVYEGGAFVARTWEFNLSVYNQLAEYAESVDLEKTKIKISRIGEGKQTTWVVVPVLKEALTKTQLAAIDAVELNTLSSGASSPAPAGKFESEMGAMAPSSGDDGSDVPF